MTDTRLQKTIFLKAPRQMVWDYLTQPEHMAKWFHAPKTALTQGQDYTCYGADSGNPVIWGKVTTARPPDYIEYTFSVGPMEGASSTVKWTLTDVPGGTQLSLIHDGLPQGEAAFGLTLAIDKGWDEHFVQLRTHIHGDA
ncbi:SRPBCC domain-containing protein [Tateyamaria omphalii]|uniref:SRPBCC family protein n=1 Tax=Tateyamaria omphalii TaxID=299262 RepID=UPI001C99ECBF|nr:SRPBCC domain-containing protein [Tateyamaria omphalii]MBY5932043.1 SRPBCC domain-containing protein [Tateyamaria omphalii]